MGPEEESLQGGRSSPPTSRTIRSPALSLSLSLFVSLNPCNPSVSPDNWLSVSLADSLPDPPPSAFLSCTHMHTHTLTASPFPCTSSPLTLNSEPLSHPLPLHLPSGKVLTN